MSESDHFDDMYEDWQTEKKKLLEIIANYRALAKAHQLMSMAYRIGNPKKGGIAADRILQAETKLRYLGEIV